MSKCFEKRGMKFCSGACDGRCHYKSLYGRTTKEEEKMLSMKDLRALNEKFISEDLALRLSTVKDICESISRIEMRHTNTDKVKVAGGFVSTGSMVVNMIKQQTVQTHYIPKKDYVFGDIGDGLGISYSGYGFDKGVGQCCCFVCEALLEVVREEIFEVKGCEESTLELVKDCHFFCSGTLEAILTDLGVVTHLSLDGDEIEKGLISKEVVYDGSSHEERRLLSREMGYFVQSDLRLLGGSGPPEEFEVDQIKDRKYGNNQIGSGGGDGPNKLSDSIIQLFNLSDDYFKLTELNYVFRRGEECLSEICSLGSLFLQGYVINPGIRNTFNVLFRDSRDFVYYRFNKLRFEYRPLYTEEDFDIALGAVFDCSLIDLEKVTFSDLLKIEGVQCGRSVNKLSFDFLSVSGNYNDYTVYKFVKKNNQYVSFDCDDMGIFFFAVSGHDVTSVVGSLWVVYEIEFLDNCNCEEIGVGNDVLVENLSPPVTVPVCVVCEVKLRSLLFRPCSHYVICSGCYGKIRDCPVCHLKIERIFPVFIQ